MPSQQLWQEFATQQKSVREEAEGRRRRGVAGKRMRLLTVMDVFHMNKGTAIAVARCNKEGFPIIA